MPPNRNYALPETTERVDFRGSLRRWTGSSNGVWFFVDIAGEAACQIADYAFMRRLEFGRARGFGSVKVMVRIGESRWSTSVFPNGDGQWMLPVKASIRRAEDIADGDLVQGELALL